MYPITSEGHMLRSAVDIYEKMKKVSPHMHMAATWVESNMEQWSRQGYIPEADLERYFKEYVPNILRTVPQEIQVVQVAVYYRGRTGIAWCNELMDWDIRAGKPTEDQIMIYTDAMLREVQRITAKTRINAASTDLILFRRSP